MPTGDKRVNYSFPQSDAGAFKVWDSVGVVGEELTGEGGVFLEKGFVRSPRYSGAEERQPGESGLLELLSAGASFGSLGVRDVTQQNPGRWPASEAVEIDTLTAQRSIFGTLRTFSVNLGFVGDAVPTPQEVSRLRDFWLVLEFTIAGVRTAWKFRMGDSQTFGNQILNPDWIVFALWTLTDETIVNGADGAAFRAAIYDAEPFRPQRVSRSLLPMNVSVNISAASGQLHIPAKGELHIPIGDLGIEVSIRSLQVETGTLVSFPSSALGGLQSLTISEDRAVDEVTTRDGRVKTIYDRGGHTLRLTMQMYHETPEDYQAFEAGVAALGRAVTMALPVAALEDMFINSGSDSIDLSLSEDAGPGATALTFTALGETVQPGHFIQFANHRKTYRVLSVDRAAREVEVEPGLLERQDAGSRILTGRNVVFFVRFTGAVSASVDAAVRGAVTSSLTLEEAS